MEFLTTSEAAAYVRLGERKLYELVTSGAIPCSKVAGKWLFPRHELDLWILSGLARPASMVATDLPPIVGGSQDDLLEWALRESGSDMAVSVAWLISAIVTVIPWLVLIVPLCWLVAKLWRKLRRKPAGPA